MVKCSTVEYDPCSWVCQYVSHEMQYRSSGELLMKRLPTVPAFTLGANDGSPRNSCGCPNQLCESRQACGQQKAMDATWKENNENAVPAYYSC